MPRIEKKIERDSVRTAEEHGWYIKKIVTPGRKGSFDRVFMKERTVWIEFKDPDGEASPLQLDEYDRLIAAGQEAHFCDSYQRCKDILRIHT